jgi:uncharacterized membrane protein YozB (DUF420 family)
MIVFAVLQFLLPAFFSAAVVIGMYPDGAPILAKVIAIFAVITFFFLVMAWPTLSGSGSGDHLGFAIIFLLFSPIHIVTYLISEFAIKRLGLGGIFSGIIDALIESSPDKVRKVLISLRSDRSSK